MESFQQARLLEIDGAHVYETPAGKRYPSITTILDRTKPEASRMFLEQWKMDVGVEEADRIAKRAGEIGTLAHQMNEDYLNGKAVWSSNSIGDGEYYQTAHRHHTNFMPHMDRIEHVYGTELKMYSDKHAMAGMADVVCRYDGLDTIMDYKTKRKFQYEERMHDYYIQTTAYALMYQELTGREMEQLVILCSIEGTDQVQEFRSEPGLWKDKLYGRLASFDPASVRMS